MKDLNKEHFEEKQDLINEVKSQADELKFCKKVMQMMLRADEIARIRSKSTFDENEDDWTVPAFIFKQKDLVFPKLQGMALVNDQQDQRKVHILGEESEKKKNKENRSSKAKDSQLNSTKDSDQNRSIGGYRGGILDHSLDRQPMHNTSMINNEIQTYRNEIRKQSQSNRINSLIPCPKENAENISASGAILSLKASKELSADHTMNETKQSSVTSKYNKIEKKAGLRSSLTNLYNQNNKEIGGETSSVRQSGNIEALVSDFNILKKNQRVNGVMLAPLKHPRLKSDAKQTEDGVSIDHLKSPITCHICYHSQCSYSATCSQ